MRSPVMGPPSHSSLYHNYHRKKNTDPCWPFPYSTCKQCFIFCLFTDGLIRRPFCGIGRGKEDGGGVRSIVGAGMRKWPTEIHLNTHIHRCGYNSRHTVVTFISVFFHLLFWGSWIWTWENDHIPHQVRSRRFQRVFYMCPCMCGHFKIVEGKGEKI